MFELRLSIDHIDGNKSNNKQSNLELVTHSENCLRKFHKPADNSIVKVQQKDLKELEQFFLKGGVEHLKTQLVNSKN